MIVFMSFSPNTYMSFLPPSLPFEIILLALKVVLNQMFLGERPGQQVQANDGGLPLARVREGDASLQYKGQFLKKCFSYVFFS